MTLTTGTRLGRYEIRSKLGEGGMGQVYLAQDTQLGRRVSIKFLPPDAISDEHAKKRLVREARAAATLDHPHICSIYEVGEADGRSFIVMQYIDGETLDIRMKRKPLELSESLSIATQVADALTEAHTHGIIHRDIKPSNVIVTARGQAKVMDFGLARKTTGAIESEAETQSLLTTPGTVIGTIPYMSPEQVKGEQLDARSDIFSFGVMLYEMLSGRQPFASESAAATASAILTHEPLPLARYAGEVPAELQNMVWKALRKDREERYQVAKDMLLDLKNLKQRLEFEAELERSAPTGMKGEATPTSGQTTVETEAAAAAPTVSSAEYIVTEIKRHRRGLAVALAASIVLSLTGITYYFYFARGSNTAIDSIAVLPLVNTGGDPNTEYLSDGISEALINNLTELRQLRVIARTTAFRYKGKDIDPQQVGRELNVRAVLTGRMREMGDMLNIQVDLVDTKTGAQLWGDEYERKVSDVLAVKQTIARQVTERLRLRLSGGEQRQLVRHDTTSAEAYQFYLRGRYFWNKRTADGIRKAIEEFQQAIDRDPNYALGYVGLADSYSVQEEYAGIPANESLPKARAAADHALQLDDSLSEAHASAALIYLSMWRWAEAEEEFRQATSLNPNYSTAHLWFSIYYKNKRQFDDAMREIKRAQELDPLSTVISQNVAEVYLLKNDLNSAIAQCQRIIELDPSFPGAHDELGLAYLKQRRYDEATAEFQKAVEFSRRGSDKLGDLGYCYAVTGRRAEALVTLKELEEKHTKREAIGQYIAGVYDGLGDKDRAFAWLEKDFEQRSSLLPWITWWFSFEDLRSDPRYADLVRRMGLQP